MQLQWAHARQLQRVQLPPRVNEDPSPQSAAHPIGCSRDSPAHFEAQSGARTIDARGDGVQRGGEPTRAVGAAAMCAQPRTWLLVISYKRFLKMAAFVTAPTTITILALHGCLLCRCVPAAWGPELLRRASREWPHIPL